MNASNTDAGKQAALPPTAVNDDPSYTWAIWRSTANDLHRDHGPARLTRDADGDLKREWFRDGRRTRTDGSPAFVATNHDTGYMHCTWSINGQGHRLDGPSEVSTDNGPVEIAWRTNSSTITALFRDTPHPRP